MSHALRLSFLVTAAALLPGCAARVAGDPRFATATTGIGDYQVPVASVLARRFIGVVRQQYDFSCGSAALATLLRHHYAAPLNETDVFLGMWRDGDRVQIRRVGFSLLDMKRFLKARNLQADGYRVSLDAIASRSVPGIALITVRSYRHFVVVKGVTPTSVLIGDPSLGLRAMSRAEFGAVWNGVYFVINTDLATGQRSFNNRSQWTALARAPIGGTFSEPVSQQALSLSAPFYRDF